MKTIRRSLHCAIAAFVCCAIAGSALAASSTPFTLLWTSPGDDGLSGRASTYELRYSTTMITEANWASATKLAGLPWPAVAGTPQSYVVTGLSDAVTYYLALKTADERGNWSPLSNIIKRPGATTGLRTPVLTDAFSSPWPNPAREAANWAWSLSTPGRFEVEIFDAFGRRVVALARGERDAGSGQLTWDLRDARGRAVPAGVYLVRATLGGRQWNDRVVVQ